MAVGYRTQTNTGSFQPTNFTQQLQLINDTIATLQFCSCLSKIQLRITLINLLGPGAERENRTLKSNLEGWRFTIKLYPHILTLIK